ncbi:hypothetical protein BGL31_00610 [Fructilactobacillus lindneri]|uniref:hypothetical protein n=1 Tax=Fructilactobacillus lindneri TaxID=53444 RepID=UPI00081A6E87|nr:hypothetical protein [Fructilactobacillus lindneri]ANZ58412.1 hypothetical protein AYR60_06560 [Fructilactobacillus lindneri]POG98484.1 hypothetical protein BGL31_00610 [Fructilactobacillus lindneri]
MDIKEKNELKKIFNDGMTRKNITIHDLSNAINIDDFTVKKIVNAESDGVYIDEFCKDAIYVFGDDPELIQRFISIVNDGQKGVGTNDN